MKLAVSRSITGQTRPERQEEEKILQSIWAGLSWHACHNPCRRVQEGHGTECPSARRTLERPLLRCNARETVGAEQFSLALAKEPHDQIRCRPVQLNRGLKLETSGTGRDAKVGGLCSMYIYLLLWDIRTYTRREIPCLFFDCIYLAIPTAPSPSRICTSAPITPAVFKTSTTPRTTPASTPLVPSTNRTSFNHSLPSSSE